MDSSREKLLKNVNYEDGTLSDAEDSSDGPFHKFRGAVIDLGDTLDNSEYSYSKVKAENLGRSSGKPKVRRRHPLLRWWYGSEYKPRSALARWLVICLTGTLLGAIILIIAFTQIRKSHKGSHKKTNPVINSNFQDPSLIHVGTPGTHFPVSTAIPLGPMFSLLHRRIFRNGQSITITMLYLSWESGQVALKAMFGRQRSIKQLVTTLTHTSEAYKLTSSQDNGNFVMYYSATGFAHPLKHCIGAAVSSTVTGPYTPFNSTLACDLEAGGAIDADGFKDPTTNIYYFVYKVDGNSIGSGGACGNGNFPHARTPIMIQPMNSSDLVTPLGDARPILSNDEIDGPNVEGPKLFYRDGWYYLIYSSGCFADQSYTVRYAVSKNLSMPFRRVTEPLIKTGDLNGAIQSPGCADLSLDGNKLIFHGDTNMKWNIGKEKRVRALFAADLEYEKRPGVMLKLGNLY